MAARSLRKKVVWILGVVLLLAVFAGIGLALALDRIVKAGIEKAGPALVKVPMKVQNVDISLLGGSFALEGFEMGNPPGFASAHSFAVGRVRVKAKLTSLLSDEVVLPLIVVENPDVTLEFAGTRTNLGEIQRNLARPEKGAGRRARKKLRIGLISVRGASVTVAGLPGGRTAHFSLPDIEVRELKAGGEPADPAEVAQRTLTALYESILRAGGSVLSSEQLAALKTETQDALRSGREALEEGAGKVGKAAGEAGKRLEGIFK